MTSAECRWWNPDAIIINLGHPPFFFFFFLSFSSFWVVMDIYLAVRQDEISFRFPLCPVTGSAQLSSLSALWILLHPIFALLNIQFLSFYLSTCILDGGAIRYSPSSYLSCSFTQSHTRRKRGALVSPPHRNKETHRNLTFSIWCWGEEEVCYIIQQSSKCLSYR